MWNTAVVHVMIYYFATYYYTYLSRKWWTHCQTCSECSLDSMDVTKAHKIMMYTTALGDFNPCLPYKATFLFLLDAVTWSCDRFYYFLLLSNWSSSEQDFVMHATYLLQIVYLCLIHDSSKILLLKFFFLIVSVGPIFFNLNNYISA